MRSHPVVSVKNMVCHRCVLLVKDILEKQRLEYHKVEIGEIHLCSPLTKSQKTSLSLALREIGLELIDTRTGTLIEKIKHLILLKARNEVPEKEQRMKLSKYLSGHLNMEYTYISSLFSDIEGRTIENFYIHQRIEKAKELLVYDEHSLSEIAIMLDYSSVAHLSAQFKKITGLTPSHFKTIGSQKRQTLDHA